MSLRLRLGLWYGALTGLVVLVVSVFTYAAHTRGHYDDLDHVLAGVANHIAGEYRLALPEPVRVAALAEPVPPGVVMRAYDAAGRLIAASPNTAQLPALDPRAIVSQRGGPAYDRLAGLAPALDGVASDGVFGVAQGAGATRWRVYVTRVAELDHYLLAAAPLDRIDASIARFRRLILGYSVAGALIALVAGWLLAGRALRPVRMLTETAGAIARSRSFRRRVPAGAAGDTREGRDELQQLAATFNEMLASLEQTYQAEQRFVSDASHELRAPLTAIQANLDLLEHRPDMPPDARQEAVHEAAREARRLAQLVADLLALARADAGVPLHKYRVELDRVLLEALGQARHLARGQRLEVGTLQPAIIHGEPDRLKQLLLVLLDNALKYTPPDGTVTLGLTRNGAAAELVVQDTGVGIPPEDLPRVFERFYRADPARARDPGGTGLGLPIARWIAEQHGGAITLSSAPGRGTTARVRFPLDT
ncbi:MAG: HAMP domain-containing protein [Chloroflexi bacterium]|nr:HAMP domain-containing protein [Chloroflexota bacterium]